MHTNIARAHGCTRCSAHSRRRPATHAMAYSDLGRFPRAGQWAAGFVTSLLVVSASASGSQAASYDEPATSSDLRCVFFPADLHPLRSLWRHAQLAVVVSHVPSYLGTESHHVPFPRIGTKFSECGTCQRSRPHAAKVLTGVGLM
jgi:hypothetical protein